MLLCTCTTRIPRKNGSRKVKVVLSCTWRATGQADCNVLSAIAGILIFKVMSIHSHSKIAWQRIRPPVLKQDESPPICYSEQCRVTMEISTALEMKHSAVPLFFRLIRLSGRRSKLDSANSLLAVIVPVSARKKIVLQLGRKFII